VRNDDLATTKGSTGEGDKSHQLYDRCEDGCTGTAAILNRAQVRRTLDSGPVVRLVLERLHRPLALG